MFYLQETAFRQSKFFSEAFEIVPGDTVLVSVGDKIPADSLILEAVNFSAPQLGVLGLLLLFAGVIVLLIELAKIKMGKNN